MNNHFLVSLLFWFVLYFGYMAYFAFEKWLRGDDDRLSFGNMVVSWIGLVPLVLVVSYVSEMAWSDPAAAKAKVTYIGTPVTTEVQNLEGKIFKPQAFVVTEQHILVYDKDGKVYALDGIKLDNLKPEQLAVGDNNTYAVYRKADQLFFGKY